MRDPDVYCCDNCYFWESFKADEREGPYKGICCRYPPVLSNTSPRNNSSPDSWVYPVTLAGDICGEFKEK